MELAKESFSQEPPREKTRYELLHDELNQHIRQHSESINRWTRQRIDERDRLISEITAESEQANGVVKPLGRTALSE